MKVLRAKKIFHSFTGERKYIALEIKCLSCGHIGIASEHILNIAVKNSKESIYFKCNNCCGPKDPFTIHKEWFDWHSYYLHSVNFFPDW